MKKGLLVLVALSIALLMGASMLVAQEKACAGMGKGTCKKEMKLTDEQKAKIEDMKMSFRLKMIDLKAEREKLGIMLKKEMMKPEPVMKDIEVVVKKMSAVREQIQLARIGHMLAMRKIIGPEAFKSMHGGMGMGCGMEGMSCCDEEEGCMMMHGKECGMGEKGGMHAKRMMRIRTEAPGCGKDKAAGHEGCSMGGAEKEIECTVEVKEVKEEAKKK
jgi:Spy/CpxP family protein refolding chaperone